MSPSVSNPQPRRMKSKATLTNSNSSTTDPLTLALQPPSTETPAERQIRLAAEKQAKQRSDEIDKLLKADHASTHAFPPSLVASEGNSTSSKKGRVYKMVLLGQAGAGKTTVLKQMRLLYDPQAHEKERRGWCKIVLLNLTASARVLLQTLERYHSERVERKSSEMGRIEAAMGADGDGGKGVDEAARVEMSADVGPKNELNTSSMPWVEHIPKIVDLERKLRSELGAFGEEIILSESSTGNRPAPMVRAKSSTDKSPLLLRPGWQERLFSYARRSFTLSHSSSRTNLASSDGTSGDEENSEALTLLRSIQSDVLALWNDDVSCRSLRKRGMFLDGQSDSATSYFLDHYPRIVSPSFTPSDEDILHSRVRTIGVTEDVFRVDRSLIYRIYDVGGSRSQRAAWAPFLDDVESIIFLAPLSAFDQPLIEEPSTNRLADTFALFNQVVSNPLLRGASMILFLNKIDLLEKKLKQGVKLQRYWPEYDGDNDFEAVWRWFRGKFRDCCRRAKDDGGKEGEGQKRRLYVHTTVATSTKQIRAILMSVKDSILRENLRVTGLVG
ncbi:probable guanine nucleotide-binding protein alpha-4 subunit [Ustilago trichophora]|uniref:Probable guanine nucleotide-binding protein alpha-4 subunit n=1 Tax=Ustilago trichophora TaxID=86804 RepID=A0A5C3EI42_9BASI|nr:probable guanine nucleotide-binding protein alpha-4 subunit [Ustilago trichophora]